MQIWMITDSLAMGIYSDSYLIVNDDQRLTVDQRVKDKHASSYRIHHQDPFCSLALLRRQVPAEIEAWPEALVCGTLDGFAPTIPYLV